MALAKGGVVDEHLLIVPIYHYSSVVALPANIAQVRFLPWGVVLTLFDEQEVQRYVEQLVKMYAARDMNVCVFERYSITAVCLQTLRGSVTPGLRDPHTQINVVPVPKQYTAEKISSVLLSHGIASRISFSAVDATQPLEQVRRESGAHLYSHTGGTGHRRRRSLLCV